MRWWVRKIAGGIVFFIAAAAVLALATMLLWNALIPALFNGPSLTFGQALGLLILSHILLRGASPWRHSPCVGARVSRAHAARAKLSDAGRPQSPRRRFEDLFEHDRHVRRCTVGASAPLALSPHG